MAPSIPVTETLTLRLKHHRTTVFLYVDPSESVKALKEDLIKALHETHPDGTLNERPLPTSPIQITLGKPKDRNDYTLGWDRVESSTEDQDEKGKAKGKAKAGDSVKLAGLKNGMTVAFKWAVESGQEDETSEDAEEEWDVVMQTYDEVYGE